MKEILLPIIYISNFFYNECGCLRKKSRREQECAGHHGVLHVHLGDVSDSDDVEIAGERQQQRADRCPDEKAGDGQQAGCVTGRNHGVEDEFVGHGGEHAEQHHHKGAYHKQQGVRSGKRTLDEPNKILDLEGSEGQSLREGDSPRFQRFRHLATSHLSHDAVLVAILVAQTRFCRGERDQATVFGVA